MASAIETKGDDGIKRIVTTFFESAAACRVQRMGLARSGKSKLRHESGRVVVGFDPPVKTRDGGDEAEAQPVARTLAASFKPATAPAMRCAGILRKLERIQIVPNPLIVDQAVAMLAASLSTRAG